MPEEELTLAEHEGFSASLGKPESVLHLRRFLSTPGVEGSALAGELESFVPKEGATLRSPSGLSDLAQRLRDALRGIEVLEERTSWLPLETRLLYCPAVAGAKVSLKTSLEKETKESCKIEVAGLGGGNEFTIRVRQTSKIEAEAGRVSEIYQVWATWEQCQISLVDGKSSRFLRLAAIDPKFERFTTATGDVGLRDPKWGAIVGMKEFDLRGSAAALSGSLEVEEGTEWKASASVEISSIALSVEYSIRRQVGSELEYLLVPGSRYRAYRLKNAGHWWWEVL